ncbi:amidase [Sporosarcina ureilytica]|uniref:Amidase n=1 Tax=Sporosarcina ureilytica TaxID=298596 RepID=A0A1D8JKD3_9BACL|nr:amidase [Sporosarcina ureilytica]AOV09174.1 amidase [Sporosarcina ureilytica]
MFAKNPNKFKVAQSAVLDADAIKLCQMIKNKQITSVEATKTYIEHIEKMNPTINSVVENRFNEALEEAQKADYQLAKGEATGQLFGVPISMKESFDVKGMQTTGALIHRKGMVQKRDADVVRKLKEEGAIILGKTNTPELCFCQETDNKLFGRTNNPRDLTRTAGGSSGGEAATIAIGAAAAGLGSDIGGSIRIPSHFNGIIGFKSGRGQISSEGSFPCEEHPLQSRMLGIGPMTKSVRDVELIYNIIAKQKTVKKELANFTVSVLPSTEYPLSVETSVLIGSVYEKLRENLLVERVSPPYLHESAELWQEIMSINGGEMAYSEAFANKKTKPVGQYVKEIVSGTAKNHRYLLWALIGAALFKPTNSRIKEIEKIVEEGDAILDDYLDKRILLFPVYHTAAPKHGVVYKEIFSIRKTFEKYIPYVAYANVWGLPSLTVPLGKDQYGMPIALQCISRIGNEDALFQLGYLLEKAFSAYERVLF